MNDEGLVPLNVQRRREEEQKNRKTRQTEMDARLVDTKSRGFSQSVDATNDIKMVDALAKVRQSNVTIPDELTRRNGSWMFNKSLKK
tara:strand:+ start:218 stop:478 length:261 start_codon:yes stop_codon:yes gene_type:complete